MNTATFKKSIYLVILLNFLNLDYCLATEESEQKPKGEYYQNYYAYGPYTFAASAYAAHSFYHSQQDDLPGYQNHGSWTYGGHSYQFQGCYHPSSNHYEYYGAYGTEVPSSDQYQGQDYYEKDISEEDFSNFRNDSFWEIDESPMRDSDQIPESPNSSSKADICPKKKSSQSKHTQAYSRKWTPGEDEILSGRVKYHLLHKGGKVNWKGIQKRYFPEKSSKSLRERWNEHLDPELDKTSLETDEKEYIRNFVLTKGNRWTELAKLLPGRSPNRLKNYWNSVKKKEMKKIVPI